MMNNGQTDSPKPPHRWRFFRAGGFDQVRLDNADDLFALDQLDPKLWVALSCPVANNEFPAATLRLLDADGDGHIRAAELIAAAHWCRERLADPAPLTRSGERLSLAAIAGDNDAGRRLRRSAEQILRNLGKAGAEIIELSDLADPAAIFGQTRFNGDGIVTALSTEDDTLREAIARIGEARGTLTDHSGEPGIDSAAVDGFFAEATAFLEWQRSRPAMAETVDPLVVAGTFDAVRAKIDDYFTRCRLAAYDERATGFMNGSDGELDAIGRQALSAAPESLAALPLARVAAGRPLPLEGGINPAWAAAVASFRQAVAPLLGATAELDEAAWQTLKARYAALAEWFAARPPCPPAPDAATLERWLAAGVDRQLRELLAQDIALSEEAAGIDEVGKLLHFVRDLANFANNFVSFRDFYTRQGKAIFQAGTLYLDGRGCELTIGVDDIAQHGGLAALGKLYLVYCACRRAGATRNIVAAMTDGDADQLMVGRNGVFVDRAGVDWDAQIVRLVEHPISLRQAFWAPYRRIGRMVGEQIQKFAANRAAAAEQKAAAAMIDSATKKAAPAAASPPAAPPFDVAKFAGIFAAIGLAIGALGTAAASVITGFIALKWWQMPLAVAGILLIVSSPSLIVAWFKLRSRTLGPLLDANGWAINARARINLPFGRSLTQVAKLPPGAERALSDPYADQGTPWGWIALGAAALGAALWHWLK